MSVPKKPKRKLVGGKKKPIPVKNVVEAAVRDDVRRRARHETPSTKYFPSPFGFIFPPSREHAFAKVPGQKPKGISRRKSLFWVRSRGLRPEEKYHIHTHVGRHTPSIGDLPGLVRDAIAGRKVTNVFYVIDPGKVGFDFMDAMIERRGVQRKGKKQVIADTPIKKLRRIVREEARKAAKGIVAAGVVVINPTKALFELPEDKLKRLYSYLERKSYEESKYAQGDFPNKKRGPQSLQEFSRNTLNHIARTYGKVFAIRFVPFPGYRYSKRKREFVKA